ncbi:MAG TPA: CocE/NonD family hydrolase [Leptospiraceae bacterium]|nr:CocE/NonD family hydrolase [Leptospiraceae bacterium]
MRLAQISRAEFYLKKGFSVLMPDLRGTGKSEGDLISFGWHERKDLLACILELKRLGFSKISVDGQSLGAAAAVYSMSDYADYEFIILESCYDNITNAFRNRINKFPVPHFVFRPVEFFTGKMIGASVQELVPDVLIAKIASPVLFLAGDSEYQIPTEETVKLFERSESKFKRLHFFKGAEHEDFHVRYRGEFEKTVSDFLNSMNVQ